MYVLPTLRVNSEKNEGHKTQMRSLGKYIILVLL